MSLLNLQRIGTGIPSTSMGNLVAYPQTAQGITPQNLNQIQEGKYTQTIYTLIRDRKYKDVIKLVSLYIDSDPHNRAGLSLLGYNYYMIEEFENAINCYETLVRLFPGVDEYRLYYSQCLYKIGQLQAAFKMSSSITTSEMQSQVCSLQSALKFELNDVPGCKMIISESPATSDRLIDSASILFKEGNIDEALEKYIEAQKIIGYDAEVCYYIALCYYTQKSFTLALHHIGIIVEHGIKEYPGSLFMNSSIIKELNVGIMTEGVSARSVGNSQSLRDSFLVEAFNLKSAIEYLSKNEFKAKEALTDMPPRDEHELDSVTLHNQALITIDTTPTMSFEKLSYLLTTYDCPAETVQNLLILYLKFSYNDVAADLLAEFRTVAESTMTSATLRFVDALLLKQTSPENAFKVLDEISTEYVDDMRKITKRLQEARTEHNDEALKTCIKEYDEKIEFYIPVIMAHARIYWDREEYSTVEKIFRRSVEFCNEQDAWKLNVGHCLFMQEDKYKEAITFYEPLVKKNYDSILDVSAIILANICVSYIMTSKNEQAEDLMKHVEQEEERQSIENPETRFFHFCIVNLVLGTLYCAKGNFEFGIVRAMKSMEPFKKKLGTETWFYAKRCIMSLLDSLAKQMIIIKDPVMGEIMKFLDECESHGKNILVTVDPEVMAASSPNTNTVAYEARLLKSYYLRL